MRLGATVLLFAFILTACGSREETSREARGREAFSARQCTSCHGLNGEGGPRGPVLEGLSAYYDEASLVAFLRDPDAAMRRDERLADRARGFAGGMAGYGSLEEEELQSLAAYLLSLD